MTFQSSLWDDSDPSYAPGCRKIRGGFYWVAPKKYAGFEPKTVRLPGCQNDGLDHERAAQCRDLTRSMLRWHQAQGKPAGTWAWLIERYLVDSVSDIWDVRASTRESYRYEIGKIEAAIGDVLLSETDFGRMKGWLHDMRKAGRSDHFIKSFFTHMTILLSYGVKLELDDCVRIKAIRGEMRIKSSARRSVYITRDQVDQVVAEADRRELPHVSLAVLLRFELMLRGVDVYGQWVPAEGRQGGIRHRGAIWVDGLTWDMIGPDCATITKQISKTRDSMPEPYRFDLTPLSGLRARLTTVPRECRAGPVITAQDGLPPKKGMMGRWFKAIVRDLGLPEGLQIRDSRSGGITEAKSMVDPYTLQHAAQHQHQHTTDRYARGRSDSANQVIALRAQGLIR